MNTEIISTSSSNLISEHRAGATVGTPPVLLENTGRIRPVAPNHELIPLPELPITVRLGTLDDLPFVDELQKKNNKNLGFMNRPTLEGKIKREEVLIAEAGGGQKSKLGYLIGNDRYFKRDELGAIFQLCVVPGQRRGLVGATLLKALFERASYGCKLYCCWCAQDLEANYFWEAMGFVPVAFRTGARNKIKGADGKRTDRVHIYWQKRIRSGDTETPWWYPHQTGGGAIDEDRIVLPIPPNVHWSEVKSVVLPGQEVGDQKSEFGVRGSEFGEKMIEQSDPNAEIRTPKSDPQSKPKRTVKKVAPVEPASKLLINAPQFGRAKVVAQVVEATEKPKREKPKREKRKNDPAKVKLARELRDRYLEEINRHEGSLESHGKYDVSRMISAMPMQVDQKLLAA